jgi:hypothetical protein
MVTVCAITLTGLLFVGILLTAMVVRTSHQALHYEVQRVAGLEREKKRL